jgi:hypothetical protein
MLQRWSPEAIRPVAIESLEAAVPIAVRRILKEAADYERGAVLDPVAERRSFATLNHLARLPALPARSIPAAEQLPVARPR